MANNGRTGMQEDWELLMTFFPDDWRDLASETGALKGLRKDKSPDGLLRVLLMHLACGHSLRETVVRARQAGLADLSDVALMKRLRKSRDWLRALCIALFEERGVDLSIANGFEIRAFDATVVKEPGKTGSLWYVHYSVRLPSLICDYFRITAASGAGTGESFAQFPVRHGDFVLGDRGYSTARGIAHVASCGGRVTVRVNTGSLVFSGLDGKPFDLLAAVSSLDRAGASRAWRVATAGASAPVQGRLCAVRKSDTAIGLAHKKLRRKASKSGKSSNPKRWNMPNTSFCSRHSRNPTSRRERFWNGIASDGRSNWCSSASSRSRSSDTCQNMTMRAPRPGCTGNCSRHCSLRN